MVRTISQQKNQRAQFYLTSGTQATTVVRVDVVPD